MTEQQPYDVIEHPNGFELRRYPAHLVAEVTVAGSFESAGSAAFRALAGYIGGRNTAQDTIAMTAPVLQEPAASQKIEMTAPVVQTQTEQGDYVIAFVLPASLTLDSAPAPTNPEVRIREVPERVAAATRYSGRWSESSYERHLAELMAAIDDAGFAAVGPARFARFDPPFKPWFLRRNEIVQDVIRPG